METLKDYLHQRCKRLLAILQTPLQLHDTETFHQLRVEIKKLRALIQLAESLSAGCYLNKKQRRAVRKVFSAAGLLREKQLEEQFINSNTPEGYQASFILNVIEQEKQHYYTNLCKKITSSFLSVVENIFAALEVAFGELQTPAVEAFLNQKNKELSSAVQWLSATPEKHWHDLRKQFKAHLHALKATNYNPSDLSSENLELITELLGSWHDCEIMICHFNAYLKLANNRHEKNLIRLLSDKLITRKHTLGSQIISFQEREDSQVETIQEGSVVVKPE
ncbi:MAG: CHAD domain-containing protein [Bernardetiaceae bacterium]|nr:CHAD domain-containing protein [Bernardetiaceae bacterium]